MTLDNDSIRSILLALEADKGNLLLPKCSLKLDHLSSEELSYHILLLQEGGLIEAKRNPQNGIWSPTRLTFKGHEYLDTVRDGEIWRLTKEGAKKVGANSISVLVEIGKSVVKQKLDEHGIHL